MTAADEQAAPSETPAKPVKAEPAPKAERPRKAAKAKPPKTEFSGRVGEVSVSESVATCTFALKGKKSASKTFSIGNPGEKMFGALLTVLTLASIGKSKLHIKTSGPLPDGEKILAVRLHGK